MIDEVAAVPPPPKLDPESLELRAAPRRVVRFRRGLLIAGAAGLAAAIAGVAWVALAPVGLHLAASDPELHPAAAGAPTDELAVLPRTYGDAVPKLGPPLPGDLGRAIVAHERDMATDGAPTEAAQPDAAAQEAAAERQRREAELRAARGAPVLMDVSREGSGQGATAAPEAVAAAAPAAHAGANPNRLQPPASRWQLSAGSVIAASLVTGLDSDVPGLVVAQVTEPAFDSATGRAVLVPQGARLIGRYDNKIAFGQQRALVVWERLVMPDGASIALDNAPATDAQGYAGLADGVDFHTWKLLRGIALSTLLGIGTQLTFGGGESDLVRALRESAQSNADRAGQKIAERNLDIPPTIRIRPGFPVRVLVQKDLVLPPWRGSI